MAIILIHGIHDNIDNWFDFQIALESKGYTVRRFAYPSRWAITYYLPWIRKNDGMRLANFVEDGDHVVAHSNGGNILQSAIKYSWARGIGVKFDKVFMFSAAATSDKMDYPDECLQRCYVVYNPQDKALMAGSKLPFHSFGSLGLLGFIGTPSKGKDRRFTNIQARFSSGFFSTNHSFYFEEQRDKWINFIHDKIINN